MDERHGAGDCPGPPDQISAFCPVYHRAIELIGRRWTGAILRVLLSGATRFTDITAAVPGLSDRLLSERLKELEAEGIVAYRRRLDSGPGGLRTHGKRTGAQRGDRGGVDLGGGVACADARVDHS